MSLRTLALWLSLVTTQAFAGPNLDAALRRSVCPAGFAAVTIGPDRPVLNLATFHPEIVPELEAILDKPPSIPEDAPITARPRFVDFTLKTWLQNRGSADLDAQYKRANDLNGHWIMNAARFVSSRHDWNTEQKAAALYTFGQLIAERAKSPNPSDPKKPSWQMNAYRTNAGHVVLSGAWHRLVILSGDPTQPVHRGEVDISDLPSGSTWSAYYRTWTPYPLADTELSPIR